MVVVNRCHLLTRVLYSIGPFGFLAYCEWGASSASRSGECRGAWRSVISCTGGRRNGWSLADRTDGVAARRSSGPGGFALPLPPDRGTAGLPGVLPRPLPSSRPADRDALAGVRAGRRPAPAAYGALRAPAPVGAAGGSPRHG